MKDAVHRHRIPAEQPFCPCDAVTAFTEKNAANHIGKHMLRVVSVKKTAIAITRAEARHRKPMLRFPRTPTQQSQLMKQWMERNRLSASSMRYVHALEDTWYVYPHGGDFSVIKTAPATEELYFEHRRAIGRPCKPGPA